MDGPAHGDPVSGKVRRWLSTTKTPCPVLAPAPQARRFRDLLSPERGHAGGRSDAQDRSGPTVQRPPGAFLLRPSNISTKGFKTQLRLSDGKTLTFGNLSWRSFTDVERDDPGYHAFVRALSSAIAKASPGCRFVGGKPAPLWLALSVVSGLSLAMIVYLGLRALTQGSWPVVFLAVLLGAASWWQVAPMVRLNKPRELATGEVPPELVPGGASS